MEVCKKSSVRKNLEGCQPQQSKLNDFERKDKCACLVYS